MVTALSVRSAGFQTFSGLRRESPLWRAAILAAVQSVALKFLTLAFMVVLAFYLLVGVEWPVRSDGHGDFLFPLIGPRAVAVRLAAQAGGGDGTNWTAIPVAGYG